MPRLHLLTQYAWPDDAPTGLYAEQVAAALAAGGVDVRLVAGTGRYRAGTRPPPPVPVIRLDHWSGRRGHLPSTALEYLSVQRSFRRYLRREVSPGDVVVVTSAPPSTIWLHGAIRRRGAAGVYWLQDYYPELVRGLWQPPARPLRWLARAWDRALARWDHVVKAAGNLGYHGPNARVIRNWNTLEPGAPRPAMARTALYSGNLGYGHDVDRFVELCAALRDQGYAVTVQGDGPGVGRLPAWIEVRPPVPDPSALAESYWAAEVHLVAADPRLPGAIFPSKLWNSLAVGRPVRASGFDGALAVELEAALHADQRLHLPQWVAFLGPLLGRASGGAP